MSLQDKQADAEQLYKRSLTIMEKGRAPDHDDGTTLNNLAFLYQTQGRYAEAEPLNKRPLALYEKVLGPDDPISPPRSTTWLRCTKLRVTMARPNRSTSAPSRSAKRQRDPDHPDVAALNRLASPISILLKGTMPRPSRSTSAPSRSTKVLDPDHRDVGTTLHNFA